MLDNVVTPRIFVAATRQDDGKTTTCVGLTAALKKRFDRVGYIKPIGQRYRDVDGLKVDEDSFLINDTYQPGLPLEAMSPIAVEPNFTRHYLTHGDPEELVTRTQEAFSRAAWEQDFVIIEGSGHAGVGSVFNMSNARVASILRSKAIIVSQGGVGKPIDEISLNLALFEKHNVEVIGVILNKVFAEKIDNLWHFAEKGLARLGLPLLGVIPLHNELQKATLSQIREELKGEFLSGERHRRRRISQVNIATASSKHADVYMDPGSLIIFAGDREDLILAMMEGFREDEKKSIAGIVLTKGFLPEKKVLDVMRKKEIPFIGVKYDSYQVASKINKMTVKTEPEDRDKIGLIQQLIEKNVNIDKIIAGAKVDA